MLVRWADPQVQRACEIVEVGCALWGTLGRQTVGQCMGLIDTATSLAALYRLAPLGVAVHAAVSTSAAAPVLAVRYRSVEILADPHSPDGPVKLPIEKEHYMRVIETADRLLIHDVRFGGHAASYQAAA